MRIAVTGATGHIGANLVRSLLAAGHAVRVLIHESTGALDGLEVERVVGDVRNLESLRRLFAGMEVAYHLAGRISIDGDQGGLVQEINVEGTRNVVTAAIECKIRRLLHTSSIHAYDMTPGKPVTEASRKASSAKHSAYDRSKAVGEEQVRQGIEQGLDAVIVNPSAVIGPLDFRPSRMGAFFLMFHQRRLPAGIEGGFDWVDVRDVCSSMMSAIEVGTTGENYILSGHYATVRELTDLCSQVTGIRAPRFSTPQWLARIGAPVAALGARVLHKEPLYTPESLAALRSEPSAPHDKARRELGHDPRPLRQSIEDIYLWFRDSGLTPTGSRVDVLPR
jgi:dihydroflavonol-4-reductase